MTNVILNLLKKQKVSEETKGKLNWFFLLDRCVD